MRDYRFPYREKRSVHKFKRRAGWQDIHHMTPKSKGGEDISSNRLSLDAYKHDAWHLIFKNLTIREVIELLERIERIKKNTSLAEILKKLFN
jgi:hypothetical protein